MKADLNGARKKSVGESRVDCSKVMVLDKKKTVDQKT